MISQDIFTDIISKAGPSFCPSTNEPLNLLGGDTVYLVEQGKVNVFAQQRKGTELFGMRMPVNQFSDGEVLLSFPKDVNNELSIEAVAEIGSSIRSMPVGEFLSCSNEFSSAAVESMLLKYMDALYSKVTDLADEVAISDASQLETEPGKSYYADGQMFSFKVLDAEIIDKLGVIHPAGASVSPLPRGFGFSNKGTSIATVELQNAEQFFRDSKASEVLSVYLGQISAQWLSKCMVAIEEFAQGQQVRSEVFNQRLSSVLHNLATVAQDAEQGVPFLSDSGNPLIAAFRKVAGAQEISLPKQYPELSKDDSNPLLRLAQISNVQYRKIRLETDWWKEDLGPLIGAIKDPSAESADEEEELDEENFFPNGTIPVALIPNNKGTGYSVYMLEGGQEIEREVTRELASQLGGRAVMLYRPLPDHPLGLIDLLRFGFKFTVEDFIRIATGGILAALLLMLIPIATGHIVDVVIPSTDMGELFMIISSLGIVLFSVAVLQFYTGLAILRINTRASTSMVAALVDRLTKLKSSFFRKYNAGELTASVMGIETVRQTLTEAVVNTLVTVIFSGLYLFLMLFYSWKLALLGFVCIVLFTIILLVVAWIQILWERKIQSNYAELGGISLQLLEGIEKIKTTSSESQMFTMWGSAFAKLRRNEFQATFSRNVMDVVEAAFLPVVSVLMFWVYVLYVQGWSLDDQVGVMIVGSLTTGDFLAFNSALIMLVTATTSFSRTLMMVIKVLPILELTRSIIAEEIENGETKGDPGELTGDIELSKVIFSYSPEAPPILKGISFHVKRGEFVALVGPSGSGKSTILRMLLGLEEPKSGQVLYDDQPLQNMNLQAVRRQIGTVMQNGRLMSGDIRDNIVGESHLSIEHAWHAARSADFAKDIEAMPMGMFTIVNGGTLSGGQRQRVLIARALVHKPKILFFDEATSALDDNTQARVAASIDRLHATRIVVAHRLSTIRNADRILVIDCGKIVQEGNYETLSIQEGIFKELVRRQTV